MVDLDGLVVRGQVSGRGVITLQDGRDARVSLAVGGDGEDLLVTTTVPTVGSIAVHVTGYLTEV